MHIRLIEGQYKSISALDWRDIPNFAVIQNPVGRLRGLTLRFPDQGTHSQQI